jgi:hypothetical protein
MKPLEGPNLSDRELQKYSFEHVRYELWMFLQLGEYLRHAPAPKDERQLVIHNAVVESFVIHLRNLISFLYSMRVQTKDIIAADYFQDVSVWYERRPPISRELRIARERSHKEVIHLTTDRIAGTSPQKRWPTEALVREIKTVMELFTSLASPDRLDPRVRLLLIQAPPVQRPIKA